MVDIYQTRRTSFLKCYYYKHENKNTNVLKHESTPDGVFYARKISSKDSQNKQIDNAFKFNYSTMNIETRDNVNIDKDDIIYIQKTKWIVVNVSSTEIIKNTEFGKNTSKVTILSLRK